MSTLDDALAVTHQITKSIPKVKSSLSLFKQTIHWIKTSPLAWFGLLFLAFFILWLISRYLKEEDKEHDLKAGENKLRNYVKKVRNSTLQGVPAEGDLTQKESKGERASRAAAERIFGKKFIKVRPDTLRNNVTKHNLEIDVYNEELKLGIEYSGRQHYEFVPFFHKNYEAFMNQKYRDEIKRMRCKEHGIRLIEIPYTVPIEDIESFIRIEANKLGYNSM
jgi:hypothetical protein